MSYSQCIDVFAANHGLYYPASVRLPAERYDPISVLSLPVRTSDGNGYYTMQSYTIAESRGPGIPLHLGTLAAVDSASNHRLFTSCAKTWHLEPIQVQDSMLPRDTGAGSGEGNSEAGEVLASSVMQVNEPCWFLC